MADELMKRVEVNDPTSISLLANSYYNGLNGLQQDHTKAKELYAKAADLGHSEAHCQLANMYHEGGDMKKAKFHYEAAAIAGHEAARYNIGLMEGESRHLERAIKHWKIAASAGHYASMYALQQLFENVSDSRESMDSTLAAYNNSCAELRSEARDAYIRSITE
jgi:TPR repeat protein